MKTYIELIDERIHEPYKTRVKFYAGQTGTLYDFADKEDLQNGFGFILNLFDFQKTSEGFEFWDSLVSNSTDSILININLN